MGEATRPDAAGWLAIIKRQSGLKGARRQIIARLWERAHLPTLFVLLLMLVLWTALSRHVGPYVLPSPGRVVGALAQISASGEVWIHIFATLRRVGAGFGAACVLAVAAGFGASRLPLLGGVVGDVAAILNSTSVFVWIVLALIWFGLTDAAPGFAACMIILPVILGNVLEGVASVDRGLLEVARVYRLGAGDRFLRVVVPSIGPFLLAGMRNGFALGLRVSVVAEIFGVTEGIGYMMNLSRDTLRTDVMFAWALVLIGVMVATDLALFAPISRRVHRWR